MSELRAMGGRNPLSTSFHKFGNIFPTPSPGPPRLVKAPVAGTEANFILKTSAKGGAEARAALARARIGPIGSLRSAQDWLLLANGGRRL